MPIIKNENYIVICGFMINELRLKGNELLVYACIYGFSQAEQQCYTGGLQYLANWVGGTKQGVLKNLRSLICKNYIGKREYERNGVKFCEYYATKFNSGKQSLTGYSTEFNGGIQQSLPNNISNNSNICLEVLNNNINTTQSRARVRVEVSIGQFEQEFDCVDWEKYPNGEIYVQVRDTLISLINNGDIAMWEVSHDLIGEILDSMYKGRERREITDMNAYIFTIIKRKRNKK